MKSVEEVSRSYAAGAKDAHIVPAVIETPRG